jgi:N-acetylglucosaminyldiphosphoundecaprenol N-acetyl-beta-D-mannosaminyltransferase
MRKLGLEWLWRIKEEPYLWRRYWNDGTVLVRLLFTHVLPFAFWTSWSRLRSRWIEDLVISKTYDRGTIVLHLCGPANARHVDKAVAAFSEAIATKQQITVDFSDTCGIDARFLGLLLMLKKKLRSNDAVPIFVGLSPSLKILFRLSGLDFK